jgi:hypothetical protein
MHTILMPLIVHFCVFLETEMHPILFVGDPSQIASLLTKILLHSRHIILLTI